MDAARLGRRCGPLTAILGVAPAVAIGDVAAHHLRLTSEDVVLHLGDVPRAAVPWSRITGFELQLPSTFWPHPAIGDTVIPILGGMLGAGSETGELTPIVARIAMDSGEHREWALAPHYLSGYRRKDAEIAIELVAHLTERPHSRGLLAHPDELLERVSAILRAQ